MGSLTNILEQMADIVRGALAGNGVDVQVEPRMVINPSPPTIDMYPADTPRNPESAGFADLDGGYVFTVRARVHTADHVAGQDLLLAFMDDEDPLCVPMALLDDPTLNGYASSVHIDSAGSTGYVLYPDSATDQGFLLGCQWRVEVLKAIS